VARKKTLLKVKNKQTRLVFAKRHGRKNSGQMRLKLSFLAIKENAMSGANPTSLITLRIPYPQ
jgi:hypothetical protein